MTTNELKKATSPALLRLFWAISSVASPVIPICGKGGQIEIKLYNTSSF